MNISISQIFYNIETEIKLDKDLTPFHNTRQDNFLEHSVMNDIYNALNYNSLLHIDYIGITSPTFSEKTGLKGKDLIRMVQNNSDKDVILYAPDYEIDPKNQFGTNHIFKIEQFLNTPSGCIAKLINDAAILPFDLYETEWTPNFHNFWIAKKEIFDEYVITVIKPCLEFFQKIEIQEELKDCIEEYKGKKYTSHAFFMESLFGLFINYKKLTVYNHFKEQKMNLKEKECPITSIYMEHDNGKIEDISTEKFMQMLQDETRPSLHDIGMKFGTDKAYLHNFCLFYEPFIKHLRYKPIRILEIGVYNGNSVRMWEDYFPYAEIVVVDINPACKDYKYNSDRITTILGDQTDRKFLHSLPGEFDIILEDGGHTMEQQAISLGCLFQKVKKGGVYILEDLHTSLMWEYQGNHWNKNTILSELVRLRDKHTIDYPLLTPAEKLYIEHNTKNVTIHGHHEYKKENIIGNGSITSVIERK